MPMPISRFFQLALLSGALVLASVVPPRAPIAPGTVEIAGYGGPHAPPPTPALLSGALVLASVVPPRAQIAPGTVEIAGYGGLHAAAATGDVVAIGVAA